MSDDGSLGWEDAYRSPAGRTPPPASARPAGQAGQVPDEPAGDAHPAWGTPDSAPVRQGPVPVVPAGAVPGADPQRPRTYPSRGTFVVLVEQNTGSGEGIKWKPEPEPSHTFPTRDAARAAARDIARLFSPSHPFSEQSRSVYLVTDDEYVVVVRGLTSVFHFRASVAERID